MEPERQNTETAMWAFRDEENGDTIRIVYDLASKQMSGDFDGTHSKGDLSTDRMNGYVRDYDLRLRNGKLPEIAD